MLSPEDYCFDCGVALQDNVNCVLDQQWGALPTFHTSPMADIVLSANAALAG